LSILLTSGGDIRALVSMALELALLQVAAVVAVALAAASEPGFLQEPSAASARHGMLDDESSVGQQLSEYTLNSLGPLLNLLGTWEGNLGLNVVALPNYVAGEGSAADFVLVTQNYTERITFSPILGAVLNRGYEDANQCDPTGQLNQTLLGVTYTLHVHKIGSDGKPGQLIHAENGQWLHQVADGIDTDWTVSRMAMIPHGSAVIALGSWAAKSGEGVKDTMEALLESRAYSSLPQNLGVAPFGYTDPYLNAGHDVEQPIRLLMEDLGSDVANMDAIQMDITTTGSGGSIGMLPNPKAQVFNEAFNATFWIETVKDDRGKVHYQQLQYVQSVFMDFKVKFVPDCQTNDAAMDCLIKWPHVQVNTLRKVKPFAGCPRQGCSSKLPEIR